MSSPTFIITTDMTASQFYVNSHKLLEKAKSLSLLSYLTGDETVPTQLSLQVLNKPLLHYYKLSMRAQQRSQEEMKRSKLTTLFRSNPLFAYEYIVPIANALNPLQPTIEELNEARLRIPYSSYAYERRHRDLNDPDIPGGPANAQRRQEQYEATKPDHRFFGTGSTIPQEVIDAAGTRFIEEGSWPDIIDKEIARHPSIVRLLPTDTLLTIADKLEAEYASNADTSYNKSHKAYTDEFTRVEGLNGSLLKFFLEYVEGIQSTPAFTLIQSCEWNRVIDSIAQSYGVADSPLQQDQVQLEFAQIELGPLETVHQFLNRVKEFCAQIQILTERAEQVAHKLTYAQAFESCIFTETEYQAAYPGTQRTIRHTQVLNRIVSAISNSRLKQVVYQFNTNNLEPQHRTCAKLIRMMEIGEISLHTNEQVLHEVSNVTVSQSSGTSSKFCAFHSYDGNHSNHETKECQAIKSGLTMTDPTNTKWLVYKSSGLHYASRGDSSKSSNGNKKRPFESNSSSSNKSAKPSAGSTAKSCTNCKKLNREGADIPERIMKTHAADQCRVDAKKWPKDKATSKEASDPPLNQSVKKLIKSVNQLSVAFAPTTKKQKKTKSVAKDDDVDDSDDDQS